MERGTTPGGVSIVILSYERPAALRALLESLRRQDLAGIDLELLLCNNSPRVHLRASALSRVGRLLRRFPDAKIFNSTHNWLCRVRYVLATLARHDVILFLDDDITLLDTGFVRRMLEVFATLGPADILSCWTALWTSWDDQQLTKVRMHFLNPEPQELTECDYVGPGISMFRKQILFHPRLLDLPPELHRSDSSWLPWLTSMELGSRKYYLPSHGMLEFHAEHRKGALDKQPGFRPALYSHYKEMWRRGYIPVLAAERARGVTDSPAARAARRLRSETTPW